MEETVENKQRVRSPAYPSVGLPEAIAMAKILYTKEAQGRHPIHATTIATDWDYKSLNGSALTTISALKQFGLLVELDVGEGKQRQLKLTPHALNLVVRNSDSAEWLESAKAVALLPKLYTRLWKLYSWPLPSDSTTKTYLELDEKFNTKYIASIIKDYKATIELAKLAPSDKIATELEKNEEANNSQEAVKIGDFVQWVSQGSARFEVPRRVAKIDSGFLFVDGSSTGIPLSQVNKVDPPEVEDRTMNNQIQNPPSQTNLPPPPPITLPKNSSEVIKQFALTTDTGDVVVRWPATLSQEDFETINGWLDGIKKKIKRSVSAEGTGDTVTAMAGPKINA